MGDSKISKRVKSAAISLAVTVSTLSVPFATTQFSAEAAADANFAKALQYSLYLYDGNMCGTEVGEKSQFDWRDDCHTSDAAISTPYGVMDLSGGFHDAGDHVKFGLPQAYSAATLGWSYYEYSDAFSSTGQAAHAKTILDEFASYLKKCTVMSGSSVQAFCYQVGDGTADHNEWCAPEDQTTARTALFATSSNPCTDIVASSAAALAINYINFGNDEDLAYAKALYSFAASNSKQCATVPEYNGDTYLDDLAWAAAWLYKATGESSYNSDAKSYVSQSNYAYTSKWAFCWSNLWAGVNAVMGDWSTLKNQLDWFESYKVTPQGYNCLNDWGSARYNTAMQFLGLVYDKHNNSSTYKNWAKGQMEYLLGDNNANQCYVVGYNANSSKYPHHRAASGLSDFPTTNAQSAAHVLVGALVGGPDSSDNYKDYTDDYTYNEVAIDYNAGFVGASAGLYTLYGAGQSVDSSIEGVSGGTTPIETTTTTEETTTTTEETTTTTEVTTTTEYTETTPPTETTSVSVTSETSETSQTSETTVSETVTTAPVPADNSVSYDVDENIGYSGKYEVALSEIIPGGAEAEKIVMAVQTASGNSFNIAGNIKADVLSGSANTSVNGNSDSLGTEYTLDVSDAVLNTENGKFTFECWYASEQLTVKSLTVYLKEGSYTTTSVSESSTASETTTNSETTVTTTPQQSETTTASETTTTTPIPVDTGLSTGDMYVINLSELGSGDKLNSISITIRTSNGAAIGNAVMSHGISTTDSASEYWYQEDINQYFGSSEVTLTFDVSGVPVDLATGIYQLGYWAGDNNLVVESISAEFASEVVVTTTVSSVSETSYSQSSETTVSYDTSFTSFTSSFVTTVTTPVFTTASETSTSYTQSETTTTPNQTTGLLGDLNADGKVSSVDLILMKKILLNGDVYPNSDMNGDGKISSIDLIAIKRLLLSAS